MQHNYTKSGCLNNHVNLDDNNLSNLSNYEEVYSTPVFLSNGSYGYIPREVSLEKKMNNIELKSNSILGINKQNINKEYIAQELNLVLRGIHKNVMNVTKRNSGPVLFGLPFGTILSLFAIIILLAIILKAVIPVLIALIIILVFYRLFG